jgi:hypothetical protein
MVKYFRIGMEVREASQEWVSVVGVEGIRLKKLRNRQNKIGDRFLK